MQEYWVNVYDDYSTTMDDRRLEARRRSIIHKSELNLKTLYLIHVKMKPVIKATVIGKVLLINEWKPPFGFY